MPDGEPPRAAKPAAEDDSSGRIWRGLRALLFGNEQDQSLRAQLEDVIDEHEGDEAETKGDLSLAERQMVRNILHFSEHDLDDIAVPRGEIITLSRSDSFADVVAAFAEHGHSRLPVRGDSLDDVLGMIHLKDIFPIVAAGAEPPADWTDLMRQPIFAPASMSALDLLHEMRRQRIHLAIVVDEYSGTDGLVTIEDLVEEIVGEIEDEHDDEPEAMMIALADGVWDADARAELDFVADILDDPRIAEVEEDVDTLGGLAFVIAGHVPAVGQIVRHDSGWRLEITGGDERRVTRLRLHAPENLVAAAAS